MKPILFDGSATNFNTNGLGVLSDCKSCLVTEERNGIYEVEFEYPITGVRYESITTGRVILVSHDERKDLQPFIIYRISRPISGIVTVNAHHISYKLNNVIVAPYTASSVSGALSGLRSHAITSNPFTFWTDKSSSGSFAVDTPSPVRALLGGVQGSILDAFGGGEYEFDNYSVKLYAHRGNNNGVTIRYGKNMTSITADTDADGLYNSVVPYWTDGSGTVVYGSVVSGSGGIIQEETWTDERGVVMQDEQGITLTFNAILQRVSVMDLSNYFDEAPTAAQLHIRAQAILNSNTPWIPKENIRIDFVALWQTEEYKDIAMLERVRLCDTVTVQYAKLGVDATAKVIRVVWDALAERYSEIELGTAKTSFADTILAETDEKLKEYPSKSFLEEAVDHATQQITGGLGGNIVIVRDGNGDPVELLIMDTKDKATAVNVWRWNLGGLGHSSNGYNGPFDDVAITQDGQINANLITTGQLDAAQVNVVNLDADNITTGTISANMINGGRLKLGGSGNNDGYIEMYDADGNRIGYWNAANFVNEYNGEWLQIIQSVIQGGYGSGTSHTLDGLLDLSAQYEDGTRKVILRAMTSDLRLMAEGNILLERTNGRILTSGGSNSLVGSSGSGGTGSDTDCVREIYFITSQGTRYMAFSPYSGTTYFAVLTTSDEKLKTNIQPAEDIGLETINKIEHKSFDFIDGGYHRDCGYIAQQLRDAIPYATFSAPENDENGNQIGETLQLNDHEILVYATKAIQELSAKVEELERRSQEV